MTLAEAAEKVIAVIDRDGWWKGWDDRNPGDRVCLRWALHRAEAESGMNWWSHSSDSPFWLLSERCDALAREEGYLDGVVFNDRTSEEDVKLLLKRAGHE